MKNKPTPTAAKMKECFYDYPDDELKDMCVKIGIDAKSVDEALNPEPEDAIRQLHP